MFYINNKLTEEQSAQVTKDEFITQGTLQNLLNLFEISFGLMKWIALTLKIVIQYYKKQQCVWN